MLTENMQGHCWHCGSALHDHDYNREMHCVACGKANHSCKNCRFFKPGIADDCIEPVADRVIEKTRANFCDYFEPGDKTGSPPGDDDPLQAANRLFD